MNNTAEVFKIDEHPNLNQKENNFVPAHIDLILNEPGVCFALYRIEQLLFPENLKKELLINLKESLEYFVQNKDKIGKINHVKAEDLLAKVIGLLNQSPGIKHT